MNENVLSGCQAIEDWMRKKYKDGAYFFKAPSVCHANWDDDDWIRFIISYGGWCEYPYK